MSKQYKKIAKKIKPKMQKICRFGNKLRPPIGKAFERLEQMNCGFTKFGQCGCPAPIVEYLEAPTAALQEFNTFMDPVTSWLFPNNYGGDDEDYPLTSIYDVVCNFEDPNTKYILEAWEEVKGILWDVIYEDVIGPINKVLDHKVDFGICVFTHSETRNIFFGSPIF